MAAVNTKENDPLALSKFQKFVVKHKVHRGCAFSHTSLGRPFGSFYIPIDGVENFYKMYADAIDEKEEIFLTEKHRHISPIVIDLDFRFDYHDAKLVRQYSTQDVQDILKVYCDEISTMFDTTSFDVFVLEKCVPTKLTQKPTAEKEQQGDTKGQVLQKDGIHIIIPGVVSKPSAQYVLRDHVLQKLKPIFERMKVFNKVNDIVDEAVIERNNWMMYGSKKPGTEPYKVSTIYSWQSGNLETATHKYDLKDTHTLVATLSIRNKHDETRIKPEAMPPIREYDKIMEQRRQKMETAKAIISDEVNTEQNECENFEQVAALVEVLSDDRANSYNDWIRLGWCLRNIDYRLLSKWDEFSQRSNKYKAGECEQVWRHMRAGGGLGIGTLYMWARQDNPTRYNEILRRDLRRLIYDSKSGTHTDVARVVHHMYQYEYVCASIKSRTWYEYRNHRWHPSDSACSLRIRMSTEVWKEYVNAAGEVANRIYTLTENEEMERLHKLVTTLHNVANKLKTTNFKDNVLRECGEMFYVDKFEEKLDSNPALIGFENGVYDLDAMEFRDGRPEDYISFSTGNPYIPYDNSHPCIAGIKEYLAQVLTKPTIREYVMKLFSTFLHGAIKEQKFHIWTGSGSNSKSKLVELYEKAFGDYCCKFPITLLTMKRAASNATTSELARAKGKRFASLQEPSEGEQINCGFMKELSGGDKIMARSLFKEPIEFVPQFKMLLLCNHLPVIPSDDGGTWRRIRVVEFTSRFVDNPVEENEFPIDTELSNKLETWKAHFMSMLLEYYKLHKVEGLTEPEEVTACTRDYKRQNDHLADFIHNCIDKKDGGFLSLNEAFAELKAWVKDDNIPIPTLPTKSVLEKYLVKALGTRMVVYMNQKGFKGWVTKNRNAIPDTEYDPLD